MRINERAWFEIDLERVKSNFSAVKQKVGSAKICCVVKANAYGNGSKTLAKFYQDLGADSFAVSNIYEGIELRKNGVLKPVINLGKTELSDVDLFSKYSIIPTVYSFELAKTLAKICKDKRIELNAHLKIDTGMNRLGVRYDDKRQLSKIAKIKSDNLVFAGAYSHLSCADCDKQYTDLQIERFNLAIGFLKNKGLTFNTVHILNSSGLESYKNTFDTVRAGIILYGVSSDENIKEISSFKCRITQVKEVKSGDRIGYGGEYNASKDMTIAVLPVGYADGILRRFKDNLKPTCLNKPCNIVGRICMDQLMIDVSGLDVKEDDTVTVFGYGGQSINELAELTRTIPYEIMTSVSERVPRVYIENGGIISADYGRFSIYNINQ